MDAVAIPAAAVAGFVFGAIWYGVLSGPWMRASGVPRNEDGTPVNAADPVPYILSFVMILVVAAMMYHVFARASVDTILEGLTYGLGIGAFLISPWLILTVGYEARPWRLGLINAGYATFGCGVMGAILILLA